MMNINLLPKVPFIRKLFWPAMISICSVVVLMMITIIITISILKSEQREILEEMNIMRHTSITLQQQMTPLPQVQQFEELQHIVDSQSRLRRDWNVMIGEIAKLLPHNTRILGMEVSQDEWSIHLQSQDMDKLAQYLERIGQLSYFDEVELSDVSLELLKLDDKNRDQSPVSRFTEQLKSQLTPAVNEHDAVLNELQWFVQQEVAMQEQGIIIPDERFEWEGPNLSDEGSSIISEEEWRAALNKYKSISEAEIESDPLHPDMLDEDTVLVYESQLRLKLKPLEEM